MEVRQPDGAKPQNIGLGSWPKRRATLTADRVAWKFEGELTTFAELERQVEELAAAFSAAGVGEGDRIAYFGPNHPTLLETLFAAGRIGAIAVILNARLAPAEVDYILGDSTPSLLIVGSGQEPMLANLDPQNVPARVLVVEAAASDPRSFEAFRAVENPTAPDVKVGLDDPCLIMYTSGTTGNPKGAVLSHGNILYSALNVILSSDIRGDDTCLAAAPLFHIAGLNGLVLPTFLKGGETIIHRGFTPQAALEELRDSGVTSMFGVPAMLDAIAALPDFEASRFPALRSLVVGGAPVPERVLRLWNSRGVEIQQGYGFTEGAPAVLLLSPADSLRKLGTAGTSQFFVDVRVVGDDGHEIEPGGSGEIVVRGPNIMLGYWGREEDTAAVLQDGWYSSGDIATIDHDGYVSVLDRSKDMYISGGENVYPSEVESALLNVPGVAEAAVIGVRDERWGEVGRAFVVAAPGAALDEETVLAGLADRLARYKQPKTVEIMTELPRTGSGKVQKHLLR